MAVIVETGAQVANANSYVSVADCNTYLTSIGYSVLTVANEESLVIQACQYVESFRSRYKGCKYTSTQSLVFPREGLYLDGWYVEVDAIPIELVRAQCLAAHFLDVGTALYNNSSGQEILSETVDVISVTYSQSGVSNAAPIIGIIESQLRPLFRSTFNVSVSR